MTRRRLGGMGVAAAAMLAGGVVTVVHGMTAADDVYAPLWLYDGHWDTEPSAGDTVGTHIDNHCARTGLFFVCEQKVAGKSGTLIVFLPVASLARGGEEYRNTALSADGSAPGGWGKLTITGNRWVYSWDEPQNGTTVHWRNVNTFSDRDRIHFEIQRSDDGKTWQSQRSGDERRVK